MSDTNKQHLSNPDDEEGKRLRIAEAFANIQRKH
jgi:hypothetical protein